MIENCNSDGNTRRIQEHLASGFCIKAVSEYFEDKEPWQEILYRGSSQDDVLNQFVKSMDIIRNSALDWLEKNGRVEMEPLTREQEQVFIYLF